MPNDLVPLMIVLAALLFGALVLLVMRRASVRLTPLAPSRKRHRR